MSTVGTISIERILDQLAACPVRARINIEVAAITGHANYQGRHRVTDDAPLYARAARWIAHEARETPKRYARIGELFMDMWDALDNQDPIAIPVGRYADRIARAWRTLDRAAYSRIPKTWRHRLETRAAARRTFAEQQADTEAWWTGRQADYAPALGLHTPTQPLKVIEEKTNV